MIRHIVMFKLQAENHEESLKEAVTLAKTLTGLEEVASGEVVCNHKDADPTNYDFALVFDFVSFAALSAYQVHPEHLKLKALLKDTIASSYLSCFICETPRL